jgi:thiamine-monophosphate kinase
MTDEFAFIDRLRALATYDAARGLDDDAAVLAVGGAKLVLTSDTLVEGVHFRRDDPADSVGWKLAAVNMSDLAAKGAAPVACLMNYALSGDDGWDARFVEGLGAILGEQDCALIGGDTVRMPAGAPRSFTLTAIGEASARVPARSGVFSGDVLWVTGTIGDAGAGLALLDAGRTSPGVLIDAYRRPQPLVAQGQVLAPVVAAMMDVSDGLLIDAERMAKASRVGIEIDLTQLPLSNAFVSVRGDGETARLFAATAGDDYQLLFTLPAGVKPPVAATAIGTCRAGSGLTVKAGGRQIALPASLGWRH